MADVSDIVNVTVDAAAAQVTRQGFGLPLIFSYAQRFPERVREYADVAGMEADGFVATDDAHRAATALCAQNPRPPRFLVGRAALRPTLSVKLIPVVANLATYAVEVEGKLASFTSDASATAVEIMAGLKAAVDALATGLTTTANADHLLIASATQGAFFGVRPLNVALLGMEQVAADLGTSADLSAIALERGDWYALTTCFNSFAIVDSAAVWAESRRKLYVPNLSDSAIATVASATATDIAEGLKDSAWNYTAGMFHTDSGAFPGARLLGARLPYTPGEETWKFARLVGLKADPLTATHLTNLRAKRCNFFYEVGGAGITAEGVVASGEFIDRVRGGDWLRARIGEAVFGLLASVPKVPMTDAGIARVETRVRGVLDEGVSNTFLVPGYTVQVPTAASIPTADRQARKLSGLKAFATAANAIHSADIRVSVVV